MQYVRDQSVKMQRVYLIAKMLGRPQPTGTVAFNVASKFTIEEFDRILRLAMRKRCDRIGLTLVR